MSEVLFLGEAEVASLLDLGQLPPGLADAFKSLNAGRTSVPPRVAAWAETGPLGVTI